MEKARLVSQTYRRMVRLRAFERALLLEAAPPPASPPLPPDAAAALHPQLCNDGAPRPRPRRRSTRSKDKRFSRRWCCWVHSHTKVFTCAMRTPPSRQVQP